MVGKARVINNTIAWFHFSRVFYRMRLGPQNQFSKHTHSIGRYGALRCQGIRSLNRAIGGMKQTSETARQGPGESNFQIIPIGKAIVGVDLILTKIALYGQKTESQRIFIRAQGLLVSKETEFGQAGK